VVLAACGGAGADDTGDDGAAPDAAFDPTTPHRYELGPFTLAPGEEDNSLCVSVELHNAEPVFIHAVRLETGGGFHHSNWFHVPHDTFRGPDGIWPCADRGFSEPVASAFGGVLFAQSTQADDELQEFPAGAAIPIAPGAKVVAALHLLNASDVELVTPLALTITPLPRAEVTVQLRPIAIEDQGLALPPQRRSTVASTCDLGPKHQQFFGTDPDFHLYYVLPHYHRLGIGMRIDAIDADGTEHLAFDNDAQIGTSLGGPIDPPFAMNGATQLRMTCRYDNVTDATVGNGIGDQEMCVMLGFTDSPNQWGGTYSGGPGDGIDTGEAVAFDHGCSVFTLAKEDL
jgi:hypothetical protein